MAKIIIGIHGLANKPRKPELEEWWKTSLAEGLKENCKIRDPQFTFKMVYWANLLYKNQQHTDENFEFDQLYNRQPYVKAKKDALKEYKEGLFEKIRAGAFDKIGDALDTLKHKFEIDQIADWILSKVMKDLAFYYDDKRMILNRIGKKQLARTVLRDELKKIVTKSKTKEIMLIAHSMGSIIANDSLRDLGNPDDPSYVQDLKVQHFITIGSPLGLPHVKGKIVKERGYDPDVRTPSIVTQSWINYADKDDRVALDIHLRDDYGENKHGVRVEDNAVANDYVDIDGKANAHKSYGYLRTPELSKQVREFLEL